jgi:phosphoribosyl 1,2-cyclic phosphodiesterase
MDGDHFFPVPLAAMQSELHFEHLNPEGQAEVDIGNLQFATCPTNHPGGCLAYRFRTARGDLVLLSDHETEGDDEARILEFIKGANTLVADSQYTSSEFATRRGWGHGCSSGVISLALKAGVKNLYMTHHDPTHDDDFIDAMLSDARKMVPSSSPMKVFAATEREQIFI